MGPLFTFTFWVLLTGIIWLLTQIPKFRLSSRLAWERVVLGALVVSSLAGVGYLMLSFLGSAPTYSTSPEKFETNFKLIPTPDVRNIQSLTNGGSDWGHQFMRFEASRQTLNRIVAWRFKRVRDMPFQISEELPEWWTPKLGADAEIYFAESFDQSFCRSCAYLIYEPSEGAVYFLWSGLC